MVFDDGVLRIAPMVEPPPGLRVEGEVEVRTQRAFAEALSSYARANRSGSVHVDRSGLTFIDLAGINQLVRCAGTFGDGRRLVLDNAPLRLRQVLRLVGWDTTPGLVVAGEDR